MWKRHTHYKLYGKVRKVGIYKMAGVVAGITGVVLCSAIVMNMGDPSTGSGANNAGKYTPPAVQQETASPVPQPTDKTPETPLKPQYPTEAMSYYRNTDQSFYSNVQAMLTSKAYPALQDKLNSLLKQPVATWLGEWLGDSAAVQSTVDGIVTKATAAKQMPVLVSYNIPNRDLGQYSAGGLSGAKEFAAWIDSISKGIGDRPAVVILEPDAMPGVYDMSQEEGAARMAMLHDALVTFTAKNPKTYVYVDAGNSKWLLPSELITLIKGVYNGVNAQPRISLNVSNYRPTPELLTYFKSVNDLYGGNLKVLLDVGMNGGTTPIAIEDWCNPRAARHGTPDNDTFDPNTTIEQLMVRPLGESSGECERDDPEAGQFDNALAATMLGQATGKYKH